MRISLIVAMAENGVIGNQGQIPWKLKSDMRFFKAITLDKPVIMGRKTYETLKEPLKQRTNIVVTRSVDKIVQLQPNLLLVPDIELAQLVAMKAIRPEYSENPEFVFIGGTELYRQAIPYCNRMYITTVYTKPDGDAVFPSSSVDWKYWIPGTKDLHRADEDNDHIFDICVWNRMGASPKNVLG